jgi:hypothetical protein
MSSALDTAIYKRLAGVENMSGDAATAQTALATLLATDPDTSKPAIFASSLNQAQQVSSGNKIPIAPCVTFRQSSGIPDRRFAQQTGAIDRVIYDIEIWDSSLDNLVVQNIAEQIELLLDMRRGVITSWTLTQGSVFRSEAQQGLLITFDTTIHASIGLVRYAFIEVRY